MQTYKNNGVQVTPNVLKPHQKVEIVYDGLLADCGANEVYVHCGASCDSSQWDHIKDFKMKKQNNGKFVADVLVPHGENFNVCFHDNADNWDNNSGENYTFRTHR